jgi:hypothetical protein
MVGSRNWFLPAALAGLVILSVAAPETWAQAYFRVAPGAQNTAPPPGGPPASMNAGFQPPVYTAPYYNPNPYTTYVDPYGGFMTGVANVINAMGEVPNQVQQKYLLAEERKRSKMDTRRKAFDQYLYERKHRPSNEDDRERRRLQKVRRAMNNPPQTEIWSGYALNTLLTAIQKKQDQGIPSRTIALSDDILNKINVTTGANEGSIGVLRDGGKPKWPYQLTSKVFKSEVSKINELGPKAYKEAQTGMVDGDLIREMVDTRDRLEKKLKNNIERMTPGDYITSKRYLNDLEKAVNMFGSPNIANFVSKKWSAQGNTVAELVKGMTSKGLKFAPATRGDEAAYTALHSALVAYYNWADPRRPWDPYAK